MQWDLNSFFFSKNLQKSPSGWGLCTQTPIAIGGWGLCPQTPVCDTFEYTSLLTFTKMLAKCHQVTALDLPFYNIFAPQKITFSKISDDVIASDLWFGPPPIKNLGYAYGLAFMKSFVPFKNAGS